jgi:FdhD protein
MGRVTDRRAVVHIDTGVPGDARRGTQIAARGSHPSGTAPTPAAPTASTRTSAPPAVPTQTSTAPTATVPNATVVRRMDTLAGEEPLEIRVGRPGEPRRPLAVTMRTPGDDLDLALGFLFTEGVTTSAHDVVTAQLCAGTDTPNTYNVVDVTLAPHVQPPDTDVSRNFYTTSSCGVCGKASIDSVRTRSSYAPGADALTVPAATLAELPPRLRAAQKAFDLTGGLHAAGLFTGGGDLVCVREDVGRHNAVDKAVGWALRNGRIPLGGHILMVSGRASFELVQKAVMAGIPMLAAVSAPSSLAVDLAEEAGITLVGFLRGATMNVYAGADRIAA